MMKLEYLAHYKNLIPEIADLKYQHYRHYLADKTLKQYEQNLERDLNIDQLPIGYVAVENGSFLGSVSLRIHDLDTHQHLTPWLGGVFVHPLKRRKGVGAFLVAQAEEIAKKRGIGRLYLFTVDKAAWYAKMEWNTLEPANYKGHPITIMEKYL